MIKVTKPIQLSGHSPETVWHIVIHKMYIAKLSKTQQYWNDVTNTMSLTKNITNTISLNSTALTEF